MDKDNVNSTFDFDNDPEFNENFYKNIEKVLGDTDSTVEESARDKGIEAKEKSGNAEVTTENAEVTTEKTEVITDDIEDTPDNIEVKSDYTELKPYYTEVNQNEDYAAQESAASGLKAMDDISEVEIEDELTDINASLAKQICEEMDVFGTKENEKEQKKKRWFKIRNGTIITLLCLLGLGLFFGFTKPGNQLLMRMGVDLGSKVWATWTGNFEDNTEQIPDTDYLDEEDLTSDAKEVDSSQIVWPDHLGEGRKEEGVYNILLMGEEAIGSGSARGRTDVIIIATLNTKNKTVKLTSLMRDMLVQIPEYQDNKLNTAYEKGGLELMYQTIAENFDIRLDGCVMVNFENFEKIIDRFGGLEITLTAGEVKYLNSTNYISKPQYRTVVEGKQLLNGNQVLGYSRVRKRATITGNNNDYGRTDRHRIVLNAVFDKYKTKSKVELASLMIGILPMITTDIDSKTFEILLNTFIEMGTTEMSQLRIPADGTFADNVKVRGMDVLIPDLDANVEVLHSFIFGDDSVEKTDSTTNTNAENSIVTGTTNNTGN